MSKIILFIASMLCFHFGTKAQNYRLLEEIRQGNNNNSGLVNQSRTLYDYDNPVVPFDFPSTTKYESFDAANSTWLKTNKVVHTYNLTAPYDNQLDENYAWANGNYASSVDYKSTYTYSSVGINTQVVRLGQSWNGTQWVNEGRITTVKNSAGLVTSALMERNGQNGFFTTFEVNITYTSSNQQEVTTVIQYDNNTGAFTLGWRDTWTYDAAGNQIGSLYQRKNNPNDPYSDFVRETHSYFQGKRIETQTEQTYSGIWKPNGLTTYSYAPNMATETTVNYLNNDPNTQQNAFKRIRTYSSIHGKELEDVQQHWVNNAWLSLGQTNYIYGTTTATNEALIPTITLTVFPNPTTQSLQLKDADFDKPTRYTIYDLQGRIAQTGTIFDSKDNIDVATLQNGQYVLSLDNQMIKKISFVKN